MVQKGPRWSKIPKQSRDARSIERNTFCIHTAWAARRSATKKRTHSTILPISMVQSFSVFFSFLFVQIFPYGQVDRLFHMSHGAIPPSLMVLFTPDHTNIIQFDPVPFKQSIELRWFNQIWTNVMLPEYCHLTRGCRRNHVRFFLGQSFGTNQSFLGQFIWGRSN